MSAARYSVEFLPAVRDDISFMLVGARDREYLSECVMRIDQALRDDPYAVGESRETRDARLLFEGALAAIYRIDPANRRVRVTGLERTR